MNEKGEALGILGLGNRSTLFYINALNTAFQSQKKGYSTFPFILVNVDFNTINPYLPNDFDTLLPTVSEVITTLEKLPITHLLIPNITIHETIDRLATPLKVLHPLSLSAKILKLKKEASAVVFGTRYTMTSPYFIEYFAAEGIQIQSPSVEDMVFIDQFRQSVYASTETETETNTYYTLLKKYSSKAPVILACTELSVLHCNNDHFNSIDLATLQIEEGLALYKNA
ncbi:aspartate/glutamate racemase family protein [Bizionia gelidisalsuginis]|uniref:Aspartate/glutamate racemase family protein n=2 Tax=Bizionia TaxID=283785 RepID=A0A8H2LD97_9FLAO|nr:MULTISPECIES: aspartate/glutamate racemase family protein [Bizionia]TYB71486.1 aspartate/glutamate racemase family protein [Bizionia saleffrena]TYC10794.1 aspartate/glutamate racemase family protein [Bizionia gelidisalsuginis]